MKAWVVAIGCWGMFLAVVEFDAIATQLRNIEYDLRVRNCLIEADSGLLCHEARDAEPAAKGSAT